MIYGEDRTNVNYKSDSGNRPLVVSGQEWFLIHHKKDYTEQEGVLAETKQISFY